MTLIRIPGTRHRDADFELDPANIEQLWQMEERHFWHKARARWILHALARYGLRPPARVLEVGCGSGSVALALAAGGFEVTGVDTADLLLEKAQERGPGIRWVLGDVSALPTDHQGPYDGLGFFDVLEHLDEPRDLLRAALRWARPGALVAVTVPALQSLFTEVDRLSGHKRRYEPGELAALLRSEGLTAVAEHGIFRCVLPLIRMNRRQLGLKAGSELMRESVRIPPSPLNALMGAVCALELRIGFPFSRNRSGGSLLALGRVPG